jgi:hypothetical protein
LYRSNGSTTNGLPCDQCSWHRIAVAIDNSYREDFLEGSAGDSLLRCASEQLELRNLPYRVGGVAAASDYGRQEENPRCGDGQHPAGGD